MGEIEEKIISFFKEKKEELLHNWSKELLISTDDIHKEKVIQNGDTMYDMVLSYLANSLNEEDIKHYARFVASQRVESNVNIGDFVHNVNVGRSEILKHLSEMDIPMKDLQLIINRLNKCFDRFLFYAVSHYTKLQNNIINQQNHLISETHKDRLTILGQMTASFVHECRNPLTAVMGFVHLLISEQPTLKYIDIIQRELKQLEFRISQFLLLSKKEVIGKEKEEVYLNELIEEVIEFLYPSIADGSINISTSLDTIKYKGFPDEIRQVFINIIFNSIDALLLKKGSRNLYVSLEQHQDSITIRISNNGPKIPEVSLKSIFEPFVSTKKLGTGLGLFVCNEIVQKHNGYIFCESNEDLTTFTIQFYKQNISRGGKSLEVNQTGL